MGLDKCPCCGCEIEDNKDFCLRCGHDLMSSESEETVLVSSKPVDLETTKSDNPISPKAHLVLISLLLVIIVLIIIAMTYKSPFVGTWSNGTGSGNLVIESTGTGYITSRFSDADKFKWKTEGQRVVLRAADSSQAMYCDLSPDGNLRVYESVNATEPIQVLTKLK